MKTLPCVNSDTDTGTSTSFKLTDLSHLLYYHQKIVYTRLWFRICTLYSEFISSVHTMTEI